MRLMDVTAFKAVVGGDVTASSTNTTKALAVASGLYSYWRDVGEGIGASRISGPTRDIAACLSACDDNPQCAGVAMSGVPTASLGWSNPPGDPTFPTPGQDLPGSWPGPDITSCSLIIGDSDVSSSMRTVTKAALGMCNRLNILASDAPPAECAGL